MIISGNSFIAGTGASDQAHAIPARTQAHLGSKFLVISNGHSGEPTTQRIIDDPLQVDSLRSNIKVFDLVILQEITNDLYSGLNSADDAYNNVVRWVSDRRAAGWTHIGVGPCPQVPEIGDINGVFPTGTNTKINNINAKLYLNRVKLGIYFPNPANYPFLFGVRANYGSYFEQTGSIHPNDSGHEAIASMYVSDIILPIATSYNWI